jgi:hypothetical protein
LDALEALFDESEFPATTAELNDALGDRELELAESQYTVREVLAAVEGDSYDSASDVHTRREIVRARLNERLFV